MHVIGVCLMGVYLIGMSFISVCFTVVHLICMPNISPVLGSKFISTVQP
jgi:hypothetical protein